MKGKRIGVLAGGTSAERDVSLRTGSAIHQALLDLGHDSVFIDASSQVCETLRKEAVDIAFIALHGGVGENGAVQGLLEVMGIPYTGSGVLASALAMDKVASKKLFSFHGIPVAPFIVLQRGISTGHPGDAAGGVDIPPYGTLPLSFDLPWVIKPAAEGSSIGVSIVRSTAEAGPALDAAFEYGDRVIVEQYIKGKEIQIGILGSTILGGVEVRPSLEFYSYEAKYTAGMTEYILPPEVSADEYEILRQTALKAHNALGCAGATRVDLILSDSGTPYVLEVNTIPGMTETSLLPKIARLSGLSFRDLVGKILSLAMGEAGKE